MSWLSFASLDALLTQLDREDARFAEPACSGTLLPNGEDCSVIARCAAFPVFAEVKLLSRMSTANQAVIKHFRNWLHLAGYGPAGRMVYGYAARLTLSLADADWRAVDPDTSRLALIEIAKQTAAAARVRDALRRGVNLFGRYLAIRQARALLPRHANGSLPWPATVVAEPDFDAIWGAEPARDSAHSGCVPPHAAGGQRRGYAKSHSLPSLVRDALKPGGLRLRSSHDWLPANMAFYANFRNWLSESGYGQSALYLYGLAARVAFSLLDPTDWRDLDPDAALARVSAWLRVHYTSPGTLSTYAKGLAKLADYLRRRQDKRHARVGERPPKTSNNIVMPKPTRAPRIIVKPVVTARAKPAPALLPDAIQASLNEYFEHCRRNWPQDRVAEITTDWWSRLRRPLTLMRDAGIPIEAVEDLTPVTWLRYVDMRLAAGIRPTTLNGEFSALRGWLFWRDDAGQPIDARMLKLRPIKEPDRVPKDLAPADLHALQQTIEIASLDLDAGARRRGIMDLAWFLLMVHSGLRTGEVRRLTPTDIDWERRRVTIHESKGLRSRVTPISAPAAAALNNWITLRADGEHHAATVFADRHLPLSQSYCYQRLYTYGARVNVRAHPHQLRHSCATLLLNAGMPLAQVQTVLGHASIETTRGYARSYDGTVATDYAQAMARVERELGLVPRDVSINRLCVDELIEELTRIGPLNQQQLAVIRNSDCYKK
jgi:integrase